METIRELYRIGHGPSSSHTMGPRTAVAMFLTRVPAAPAYRVTLYGSLAATGKGHLTDATVREGFGGRNIEIIWRPDEYLPFHPNALRFDALDVEGRVQESWTAYSVGGGKIVDNTPATAPVSIYPFRSMDEIVQACEKNGRTLWEIVEEIEGPGIWDYLGEVWKTMSAAVRRGLKTEGTLPGGLHLPRKARSYFMKSKMFAGHSKRTALLFAYALAVSEENAAGGLIVTAPTCGSAGVVPAVLYHLQKEHRFSDRDMVKALAAAGILGNLAKTNASISGAEVGCQGEVGVACAMASGAAAQLLGGTVPQIEYAAEMGMEHHLGLTCDPVLGLVQIPCIERNVFAASRSISHAAYALLSDGRHRISYDEVLEAMRQTGKDLSFRYKETAAGGLAVVDKE
ncbi:MAG: L-serine ammonia-lyase [Candidatus Aminicenantes bacterium]|nr:L-serine ammonia-lyase [Candidatus Aminicenantes bacterium]